ncbi:MAG TPA: response regulator [Thermoanaerobaculia bacterium]|jgi:CheY-like chemotaxis protein|nr:response regulator [Thermoanaerobaculia bacterium]HQN06677.1 response regulator [Thermoanaerobaculia bacterium]HQP85281.1 response regulator [Thermoanaerobaculia bacterium]
MSGNVLVVEDNEQNLYLVRFLLEGAGWTVVAAPDGPRALEEARSGRFDLVLLDIQLPGMDGHAVARELRRIPALDGVPIVAVTSYAMLGDRERCLEAGCTGYVEKPINPDTFLDEVASYVRPEVRP